MLYVGMHVNYSTKETKVSGGYIYTDTVRMYVDYELKIIYSVICIVVHVFQATYCILETNP